LKITSIEIRHYRIPLDPPFKAAWDPAPRKKFAASIVRVNTDAGITGIGLIANLHLACAVSKCPFLEFPFDPPAWTAERRDYMLRPGLGCELDEEALSRYEVNTVFVGEN
jgi:L-alanine-DL-glutamate epimerase-like enolase superfamily enzyme